MFKSYSTYDPASASSLTLSFNTGASKYIPAIIPPHTTLTNHYKVQSRARPHKAGKGGRSLHGRAPADPDGAAGSFATASALAGVFSSGVDLNKGAAGGPGVARCLIYSETWSNAKSA